MNKISATEAKQSLGMLLDTVQHKPIEIQRQGRSVAVILSMEDLSLKGEKMSNTEVSGARFLKKWAGKIKSTDFDKKVKNKINPASEEYDPRLHYLIEKHMH